MDDYMQEKSISSSQNLNCTHSRKIPLMVESDQSERQKFIESKHFKGCRVCQRQMMIAERNHNLLIAHIPVNYPRKTVTREFQNEARELMKGLKFVDKSSFGYKFNQYNQFVVDVFRDIKSVITSENMVKVYMLSVILGVTLKIFF